MVGSSGLKECLHLVLGVVLIRVLVTNFITSLDYCVNIVGSIKECLIYIYIYNQFSKTNFNL